MISEEQSEAKKHLEALSAFVDSIVHSKFKVAMEFEIKQKKDLIIALDPETRADEILLLKSRGELNVLYTLPEHFENALAELKTRVDDLVERDNATSKQTEDDD